MSKAYKPTKPFPRLPFELDKRWKIKPSDIPKMKLLKDDGWTFRKIARKFNLKSPKSVYEHLLPLEEKRRRNNKKARRRAKARENDPQLNKTWKRYWATHRKRKYTLQKEEMRIYDRGRGK